MAHAGRITCPTQNSVNVFMCAYIYTHTHLYFLFQKKNSTDTKKLAAARGFQASALRPRGPGAHGREARRVMGKQKHHHPPTPTKTKTQHASSLFFLKKKECDCVCARVCVASIWQACLTNNSTPLNTRAKPSITRPSETMHGSMYHRVCTCLNWRLWEWATSYSNDFCWIPFAHPAILH